MADRVKTLLGGKSKTPSFDTALTPAEERKFQEWKAKYAPDDSGVDYDLRGAFKEGFVPDAETGHWSDKYKKPNHPTFSNESKYAKYGNPGHWEGEGPNAKFIPPVKKMSLERTNNNHVIATHSYESKAPEQHAVKPEALSNHVASYFGLESDED